MPCNPPPLALSLMHYTTYSKLASYAFLSLLRTCKRVHLTHCCIPENSHYTRTVHNTYYLTEQFNTTFKKCSRPIAMAVISEFAPQFPMQDFSCCAPLKLALTYGLDEFKWWLYGCKTFCTCLRPGPCRGGNGPEKSLEVQLGNKHAPNWNNNLF